MPARPPSRRCSWPRRLLHEAKCDRVAFYPLFGTMQHALDARRALARFEWNDVVQVDPGSILENPDLPIACSDQRSDFKLTATLLNSDCRAHLSARPQACTAPPRATMAGHGLRPNCRVAPHAHLPIPCGGLARIHEHRRFSKKIARPPGEKLVVGQRYLMKNQIFTSWRFSIQPSIGPVRVQGAPLGGCIDIPNSHREAGKPSPKGRSVLRRCHTAQPTVASEG